MKIRIVALAVLAFIVAAGAQETAPTLDEAFQSLPAYTLGDNPRGLELIRAEVNRVYGDAEARDALEDRFIAVLEADATPDAKRFVCRQLLIVGTARSVPALSKLLCDPATADDARYALERMNAPEAGAALRAALDQVTGKERIGVINSLGVRQDADAVPALITLLDDADAESARAAVEALTRIGNDSAREALRAKLSDARTPVKHACEDGLLACAERDLARGAYAEAAALYESLYAPERRDAVRVAAFQGMARARVDDTAALVEAALSGDDEPVALAALRLVRSGEVDAATAGTWLAELLPERKTLLLDALADQDDPSPVPAIIAVARRPDDDSTLHAALRALGALGGKTAIPVLARAAAEGDEATSAIARANLARLRGDDIDRVMVIAARAGSDDVKLVLLEALGERVATSVAAELIDKFAMSHDNAEVRKEALRALAKIAGPEHLDALVAVLLTTRKDEVQTEAARAIVAAAARAEGDGRTKAIRDALPGTKKPYTRAALIEVLGRIGDPSGLEAIRATLQDSEVEVRAAAVDALSAWPHDEVMTDLAELAANAEVESWREAALAGYVRLIRSNVEREKSATLDLYRNALHLATRPAQLRMVLSGLADVPDPAALAFVRPLLENNEVSAEARITYDQIRRGLMTATASHSTENAMLALDNDPRTRWDTGVVQFPGQWFQLDLVEPAEITRIVLDTTQSPHDYPRAYEVYIAHDLENLGAPVATGTAVDSITAIDIPNVTGRYIHIVQTGSSTGKFWSIHECVVEMK